MTSPFFPYPHLVDGVRIDGSLRPWPETCEACRHRNCESGEIGKLSLCSYGLNYYRVSPSFLVAGVVLFDFSTNSQARVKRRRELPVVRSCDLMRAIDSYKKWADDRATIANKAIAEQQRELLDEEQFRTDYLEQLKVDIQKGLSFFHDYRQINTQIIQNMNVVLEERYPGETFEERLAAASHAERAIYEAARFLEEKLNVAKFLVRPEWLQVSSECRSFRVHGMVLKYIRIYESFFKAKSIDVKFLGESHNEIVANPSACGVIPHTLIDNALKYAPRSTTVEVFMEDREEGAVYFDVACFGPKLSEGEDGDIFRPFYRGEAAKAQQSEGAGYGLYISQLVAREHLGTRIEVEQDCGRRHGDTCWTTFRVELPQRAAIL